ncbi:hypothetical protein ACH46N_05580 [Streptomyces pristinaespiralis]|jgi:hypothetical protein|uniref:Putative secreted protein n=1 Tax=Streptomyces pristinaespiralis TaxID=38300 RepID=A0A0M3QH15_STRPR|nr:hypothetical protein [Streptomyces pristinaespiralis]ALC18949.1 putative secreted protein [Streptomyces pristinaespiralis]QMU17933.1 hypothetical protein H3L99_33745 [Streptomyces pristinaespiralis]
MRSKRSFLGIVGVLAWTLMAVVSTGSAQAATASGNGVSGDVRIAPPAPHDGGTRSARAEAAVSPTVSPAAHFIHRADGELFDCAPGNLCVEVWDPTVSKWKIFFLYHCNRYWLSDWHGNGYYLNKQTGGVTSYFYGQGGDVRRAFTPPQVGTQDWTPVWSIRNC